jgi:hypothetical protein
MRRVAITGASLTGYKSQEFRNSCRQDKAATLFRQYTETFIQAEYLFVVVEKKAWNLRLELHAAVPPV